MSRLRRVRIVGGEVLLAHPLEDCLGRKHCVIHNPSDHVMSMFPQHWRSDRGLMERICPHGVGHPDPDHMEYYRSVYGREDAYFESVHGCDGCCRDPERNTG